MKNSIIDPIAIHLRKVQAQIQDNIIITGKEATGKTRKSIKTIQTENTAKIEAAGHIQNLETGTPPTGYSKQSVADLWRPPLVDWAKAKPITPKDDGVKKSKYTLIERWTRGVAYLIVDKGSRQFQKNRFDNIFSKEITKAAKDIPKIAAESVKIEVHEIVKQI